VVYWVSMLSVIDVRLLQGLNKNS